MSDWKYDVDDVENGGSKQDELAPGSPSIEHAVFVLLGALATLLVVARVMTVV